MLNLKKTALAVIALGSTAAFAGTMGPVCSAVNVTVPCENTAWDIGGRALYLQPSSSGLAAQRTITTTSNTLERGVNPAWGWGFQLEASYHYSTGNDFDLNWYHFRNSNSRTLAAPVYLGTIVPPQIGNFDHRILDDVTVTAASQSNNPAWDQVNMEFGQHVDFGENKYARFHAGMNYSRVADNANTSEAYQYIVDTTTTRIESNLNASSVYNGFGPRVGMDLTYDWGNGLSVYGTGALSVLAGSTKNSFYVTDNDANGLRTRYSDVTSYNSSISRVVPELDGKLGFMYTYAMAQGDLSLDVGWVWASYMGALSSNNDIAGSDDHNFGIQGLYFGLKWVGNVA